MTREGVWNSSPAVIALQKAVIAQSRATVALLDRTKLGRTAPQFLGGWEIITALLTDVPDATLVKEGISADMTKLEHINAILAPNTAMEAPETPLVAARTTRKNLKTTPTLPTSLL